MIICTFDIDTGIHRGHSSNVTVSLMTKCPCYICDFVGHQYRFQSETLDPVQYIFVLTEQQSHKLFCMPAAFAIGIMVRHNQPVLKNDPVHSGSLFGNTETGGGRPKVLPSRSVKRYFLALSQSDSRQMVPSKSLLWRKGKTNSHLMIGSRKKGQ